MGSETRCIVVCSCGATTTLHLPRGGTCWAEDPSWQFHGDPDVESDKDRSRLWNCGGAGHYQAGLRDPASPR